MRQSSTRGGFPAGNPIANVLVVIVGALAIGASIVLGFFAFVALSGIILVTAAIVGMRVWWLGRKLQPSSTRAATPDVIEGEYRVVENDRDEA